MILKKEAKTVSGQRVIGLNYVPYNSAGRKVTFPIKGTIVVSEKPLKTRYMIWTEHGKTSVFSDSKEDLKLY